MSLPSPGPGRPHHSSYSQPGPTMTVFEALVFIVAVVVFAALIGLACGEAVI